MSDASASASKSEPKRPWTDNLYLFVIAGLPAGHLWTAISDGESTKEVWVGAGSWTLVSVVTVLIVIALNRIMVNMTWHRKPFTEKDYKYCLHASNASLLSAVLLIAYSFVAGAVAPGGSTADLAEVISTQTMFLIMAAAILRVLARVHHKGSHLYEELEKGV